MDENKKRRTLITAAAVIIMILIGAAGYKYYDIFLLPGKLIDDTEMLIDKGEYETAVSVYERAAALKDPPKPSDALMLKIADAYERIGRYESAASLFKTYIDEKGGPSGAPDIAEHLADVYITIGDNEAGRKVFAEISNDVSGDVKLWHELAIMYEYELDDASAAVAYRRMIDLEPKSADEYLDAGRCFMRIGEHWEALAAFEVSEELAASDDKRPYHAVKAAKDMLGWPTDAAMVITPGMSLGHLNLGMTREQALEAWGKPLYKIDEVGYSVWGYSAGKGVHETLVYFDDTSVIEIVTESKAHATVDGLSLANFQEPKYRYRFTTMRDINSDDGIYRYTLVGGGLAFYVGDPTNRDRVRAVIYGGASPMAEHFGAQWAYFWD